MGDMQPSTMMMMMMGRQSNFMPYTDSKFSPSCIPSSVSCAPMSDSLLQHMATSMMSNQRSNNNITMSIPQNPLQMNQDCRLNSFNAPNDLYEPVPLGRKTNSTLQSHSRPQDSDALARFLGSALDEVMDMEPIEDLSSLFDTPSTTAPERPKKINTLSNSELGMPPAKRQRQQQQQQPVLAADDDKSPRFRPYQEKQWVEQFEELLKYKEEQGHCLVPHTFPENPILSRWVKRQRYQYKLRQEGKTSTMTAARMKQLEEIGFVWDSHGAAWQERRNELAAYQKEHGDCNVPSCYPKNPQLATWVKCQRRQCKLFWNGKTSNMTLERFTSLNDLGFAWELRAGSSGPNTASSPTSVVEGV
eukprot:scaffold5786_cov88-Cylindrotheca_fusiformis.AAC.1